MGWKPNHKRIRETYNPVMNAVETRHKARVEQEECFGCSAWPTIAHHLLSTFEGKRWRRDHQALLPVCHKCHHEIHDVYGAEGTWLKRYSKTIDQAVSKVKALWAASQRDERRAA